MCSYLWVGGLPPVHVVPRHLPVQVHAVQPEVAQEVEHAGYEHPPPLRSLRHLREHPAPGSPAAHREQHLQVRVPLLQCHSSPDAIIVAVFQT